VTTVAGVLGLKTKTTGSGTFQRRGKKASLGAGAEPDQSFYIANYDRFPRDRDLNLDAGDPPPDLWIEVDNSVSSKRRYSIYASLGVPEVWCYRSRAKSLDFLRLVEGRYESIEWSLALPVLSPTRVLEVLPLIEGLSDQDCILYLGDWARRLVDDRAGE